MDKTIVCNNHGPERQEILMQIKQCKPRVCNMMLPKCSWTCVDPGRSTFNLVGAGCPQCCMAVGSSLKSLLAFFSILLAIQKQMLGLLDCVGFMLDLLGVPLILFDLLGVPLIVFALFMLDRSGLAFLLLLSRGRSCHKIISREARKCLMPSAWSKHNLSMAETHHYIHMPQAPRSTPPFRTPNPMVWSVAMHRCPPYQ